MQIVNTFPLLTQFGKVALEFPNGNVIKVKGTFRIGGTPYEGYVEFFTSNGQYDPFKGIRFSLVYSDPVTGKPTIIRQTEYVTTDGGIPATIVYGTTCAIRDLADSMDWDIHDNLRAQGKYLLSVLRSADLADMPEVNDLFAGHRRACRVFRGEL